MADVNILIAVPCYGGALQSKTAAAIIGLDRVLNQKRIGHVISFIHNESLISRARNRFANHAAFDTDDDGRRFSHLLFIDADIIFDSINVVKMIEAGKPICALPYARKNIVWEQVAEAARLGVPDNLLEHFVANPCINHSQPVGIDGITQIDQIGTAVMLIDTQVFEAMVTKHPEWKYKLYPEEVKQEGGQRDYAYDFFKTGIDPKTKHYLSEDFFFVEQAKLLGFQTYFLPDAITRHIGSFEYVSNLRFVIASGVGFSARNVDL